MANGTLDQIDFGVEIYPPTDLSQCHFRLHYIFTYFDYSRLMRIVAGEIPSWFFQRFAHIQLVITSGLS